MDPATTNGVAPSPPEETENGEWQILPDISKGKPLQLFDFIRPEDPDADTEIKLNDATINKIVEECGDRPLCVVAIVGPSREGKSLVLNFMIRCLAVLEKGETDWIGWNDKTKPLEGFAFQTGLEPQTRGILIWSRPFFLKNADGKEVAILLVDTQGTNDEYTTLKDMSSIVGLSLLSSSITIFNNMINLQEDILHAINAFTEYGLLAMETEQGTGHPFQSLCFLIRDWNNPDDFPYGGKGGKQFLKRKLELKPNQSKEAKAVRKALTKCFDEVNCFLMPSIGEDALSKNFSGKLEEVSTPFAKKLEEFVNSLFKGEDLVTKKILGKEVTALELKSFLEMYVQVFNSDTVPSAEIMMEAVSKVHNDNVIRKASSKYIDHLRGRMRRFGYIQEELLSRDDVIAKKMALEQFRKMKKFGDAEKVEELEQELHKNIDKLLKEFKTDNQDKRNRYIKDKTEESVAEFKSQLEAEFPLIEELSTEFYDEESLSAGANNVAKQIIKEFKGKFPNEDDQSLQPLTGPLKLSLLQILEAHKNRNLMHVENARKVLTDLKDSILKTYEETVDNYFRTSPFIEVEAVDGFELETKQSLLQVFRSTAGVRNRNLLDSFERELENAFNSHFEAAKGNWSKENERFKEVAKSGLDQALGMYANAMRKSLDSQGQRNISEARLRSLHDKLAEKVMESFQGKWNPYPPESALNLKYLSKLKTALEKAYEIWRKDLLENLKETEENLVRVEEECLKTYIQKLKDAIEDPASYLEEEGIDELHQNVKQEALEKFRNFAKDIESEGIEEVVKNLEERLSHAMDKTLDHVKKDLKRRLEEAEESAKKTIQQCSETYLRTMKVEINENLRTEEDFKAAHEREEQRATQFFLEACPIKDPRFTESHITKLKDNIAELLEGMEDLFELKKTQRESVIKEIIGDCRDFYKQEMEKNVNNQKFILPKTLRVFHMKAINVTVNRIQTLKQRSLTPQQRIEVADALESIYQMFKDRNDMNLNMDTEKGIVPAIGIDLGTTYCCVGVFLHGKVHIIPNTEQGNYPTTPSYVMFNEDGSETVGLYAKENAYKDPENTIFDAKRIIGRRMNDRELQEDIRFWPFKVREDGGVPKIDVRGRLYYPEQVSGKLLTYLREMAEKHLNLPPETIKKAVITVPANFSDGQRQATIDAGTLAGLEVLQVLNEPTAAAIAYSLERMDKSKRKVLVFDLGGGTFDVAILDVSDKNVEVLGVKGDTHLGGQDFDKNIMKYCSLAFQQEYGLDIFEDKDSVDKELRLACMKRLGRLQPICEKAKKELTSTRMARINVQNIMDGKDLDVELTRDRFNQLNRDEMDRAINLVREALQELELEKEEIDDVVMIGGSSRILMVQQLLSEFFDGKALNHSINPDEAVAYGAAVKAAMLNGEEAKKEIGIDDVSDVTPLSLGLEIVGGYLATVIPKNTKVPCVMSQEFATERDNQTQVYIDIYQGEDRMAKNNELLGQFVLSGIPPAPAEQEKVDVTMTIDGNGILHVEAVCRKTQESKSLTIHANRLGMSRDAIRNILAGGK